MTVSYDNSVAGTTNGTAQTLSLSLTVGSSGAVVIANVYSRGTISSISIGGTAMTLLGTYSGGRIYYATGIGSGSKSFSLTSSGYLNAAVVASYLGVSSVDTGSYATSTSSTAATVSSTPVDLVVSGFANSSSMNITATSGTRRNGVSTGDPGYLAIIDGTTAGSSVTNVGANATSSGSVHLIGGGNNWTGDASSTFTESTSADGVRGRSSGATSTFTETTTADGSRGQSSGAATTITQTATTNGVRGQSSTAATTTIFSATVNGAAGGSAVTTITETATADGSRGQSSGATSTFGFGATADGTNAAVGMATLTIVETATANGFRGTGSGAATAITANRTANGFAGDFSGATTQIGFGCTVSGAVGGDAKTAVHFGAIHGGQVHHNGHHSEFNLGDFDPWVAMVEADRLAERRAKESKLAMPEFDIDVYTNVYGRAGQITDYISATVTFVRNNLPTATVVLKDDDPLIPLLETCNETVVPITFSIGELRWSGRVDVVNDDIVDGVGTVTIQCVGDWNWLNKILVWPNFLLPIQVQFPKEAIYIGAAVTVIETMLTEQIIRLQSGLWEMVNNILNPASWFATLMMGKGLLTPCAVIPRTDNLLSEVFTDTSKWCAVTGRMDTVATLADQICKDNGIVIDADLWLPGEPQPTTMFTLSEPTICFRVRDKSGVTGPTGTLLDGILKTGVDILDGAFGEVIKPFLNPANQYAPDGVSIAPAFGVDFVAPWPIYNCDNKRSGIKECHTNFHHPLAYTVIGGGKSPEWVNKLIDLLLEAAITAILVAIAATGAGAAAAVSGIPTTLLDGVFDNVILAFQLVENSDRRSKLGPYGYPEFFSSTGSTAYTLDEFFALEIAMWDTRGYISGQITAYNGTPYTVGKDFAVGDLVSWIRRGKLYTDYVTQVTVTDDRSNRVSTEIQVGDGAAQESPWARLQRGLSSLETAAQAALLSSN